MSEVVLFSVPLCLSGGATGADLQFGMCAGTAGHTVIHFSFAKHRTQAPVEELCVLTPELLSEADPHLLRANKTLGRHVPFNKPWIVNLLRRNWYQVRNAESVYAVASFDEKGLVDGGSAWATQIFIDRFEGKPCACYVFDQKVEQWYAWEGHWQPIDAPPTPTGVYAGIGSRDLLEAGKQAIRRLLNYTAPSR